MMGCGGGYDQSFPTSSTVCSTSGVSACCSEGRSRHISNLRTACSWHLSVGNWSCSVGQTVVKHYETKNKNERFLLDQPRQSVSVGLALDENSPLFKSHLSVKFEVAVQYNNNNNILKPETTLFNSPYLLSEFAVGVRSVAVKLADGLAGLEQVLLDEQPDLPGREKE